VGYKNWFFVVVIACCFSGCVTSSGQLSRDTAFSSSSTYALMMFGVDVQSDFKSPLLVFRKYDPQTGKVDLSGIYHASPRIDGLTDDQKLAAAMTGQNSRPGGHGYFVIGLPEGDWFLWAMSGFYSNGLGTSYSSTSYFSSGTIAIKAKAGEASYLGEFVVSGKYGSNLKIMPTKANFAAAQLELQSFARVDRQLIDAPPTKKKFACSEQLILWSKTPCGPKTIVVSDL
jgi:hypothetical protein